MRRINIDSYNFQDLRFMCENNILGKKKYKVKLDYI